MSDARNWQVLYREIAEDIRLERFPIGSSLPTQSDLADRYAASRHSVRRALGKLSEDGVISSWQGKQAVVIGTPVVYQINEKTRFASRLREEGHDVRISALRTSRRMRVNARVARMLRLSARETVSFGEFMHHVNKVPTALGRHYFNSQRFPNILEEVDTSAPSVPEAFRRLGVRDYFRTSTIVEVRQPTAYEALVLEISPNQPVLDLWGQNIDSEGQPIEVTEAVVRTDMVKLEINSHQVADLA